MVYKYEGCWAPSLKEDGLVNEDKLQLSDHHYLHFTIKMFIIMRVFKEVSLFRLVRTFLSHQIVALKQSSRSAGVLSLAHLWVFQTTCPYLKIL